MNFFAMLVAIAPVQSPNPAQEAPAESRGLILHEEGAFDGYTLISPLTSKAMYLIDMEGQVAKRWELDFLTESGYLLDDGHLLLWGVASLESNPRFNGPGVEGGLVLEMDWDGDILWKYVLDDDDRLLHHDVARMPNGNLLILAWEHRYRESAVEWGRDPAQVGDAGMWPDAVYELHPTPPEGAEIVWEWHVWDHVIQDFDPEQANYGSVPDNPGKIDINVDHRDRPPMTPEQLAELKRIEREMAALGYGGDGEDDEEDESPRTGTVPDWLHTNGIDYQPEYDLIVLSTPNQNELWVIDHSTTTEEAAYDSGGRWGKGGDILWRWGNPRNYGAGTDADQKLFFQHQPTWVSGETPGELRLLVFNNGRGRPGGAYSSVDELVLPFDPEQGFLRGEHRAFGPEAPVWSFSAGTEFFSSFISGTQRLANGNTLICSGTQGRVFEVTPAGRVVWDYLNPYSGNVDLGPSTPPPLSLYRATRISKDHPGLAGKDL
ncbi:MAG: hypothetical protein E2O39_09800 [Planctomycetota bacterium]|nr:MAG: hypothetical protein E2O39_09800 [Planctomycetota bacterium]